LCYGCLAQRIDIRIGTLLLHNYYYYFRALVGRTEPRSQRCLRHLWLRMSVRKKAVLCYVLYKLVYSALNTGKSEFINFTTLFSFSLDTKTIPLKPTPPTPPFLSSLSWHSPLAWKAWKPPQFPKCTLHCCVWRCGWVFSWSGFTVVLPTTERPFSSMAKGDSFFLALYITPEVPQM